MASQINEYQRQPELRLLPPVFLAILFAGVANFLALASPVFMLEIYDRVIPSRSIPTLIVLLIIVAFVYTFCALLDVIRSRLMARVADIFDISITTRLVAVVSGAPLLTKMNGDVLRPIQDVEQVRLFLSGPGPGAIFDLPWMPIYLAVAFFVHPLIGWLALSAMSLLLVLTGLSDLLTRKRTKNANTALSTRNRFAEAVHRNAEAIAAMGFLSAAQARWMSAHLEASEQQRKTSDIIGVLSNFSRTIRQLVQASSLALGAWLVIRGDLSGGAIFAASLIVARSLQPIEQLIGNWRNLIAACRAWRRLNESLKLYPEEEERTELEAPRNSLAVEDVFVSPPGERHHATVKNATFQVNAGSVVGIIGPSASGKSSLVRAVTGVWSISRGRICLDNAGIELWSRHKRGRHIGYMPQSSDLFPGTIAENIARLNLAADSTDIVAAAKIARAHDMIVSFPQGYETQVGDGGTNLSAGQRQRIALARALYGDPFLVVLDEPNSNLDADGDRALADAIADVKQRKGIVLVVAHRNSILPQIDYLLVMENGCIKLFGQRDVVLTTLEQRVSKQARPMPTPTLTVIDGDGVTS